jgi:hypothetical protein
MAFTQLDIHDSATHAHVLRVMKSDFPVALVQFPAVFALVAPSTELGVQALNRAKQRLDGKYYGSAIGSLEAFANLALVNALPTEFRSDVNAMRGLEGAFIRLDVSPSTTESAVVAKGTHQGLLLPDGPHTELFRFIENTFHSASGNSLFAGAHYFAPLCTSANLSGDAAGSIVDLNRALSFAYNRDIELLITCNQLQKQEVGSYPIFAFRGNTYRIEREGPAKKRILQAIPKSIVFQPGISL